MTTEYYALTSLRKPSGLIRKRDGFIPELLDLETLKFSEDSALYRYFFAQNAETYELIDINENKAKEIIENFKKKGTPYRAPEEEDPEGEDPDVPEGEVKEINFYE